MAKRLYTEQEDETIRRMRAEGCDIADIAAALGRSRQSVYGRIHWLSTGKREASLMIRAPRDPQQRTCSKCGKPFWIDAATESFRRCYAHRRES